MAVRKVLTLQSVNSQQDVRRALTDIENAINRLANPEVVTDENTADDLGGGAAGGGLTATGDVGPAGPTGPQGLVGPQGKPGPGFSRSMFNFGTGVLASGTREQGQFNLSLRADLLLVSSNTLSRLILYQTANARTADLSRTLGTPVPLGQGIIAEFAWDGVIPYQIYTSPTPRMVNNDIGESDVIYYTATNRSLVAASLLFQLRVDLVAAA